jgi:coenzyme F420-reducing hydrogenase beta subunit
VIEKLKNLLKDNREERKKKKIRVGLVWLENTTDTKLKEMINEYGYDFGLVLEAEEKKGNKNFAEKLGDVIEDIIENPQKY